jgi:16S rRNA C967 or C1407 C5-methylase (RsmB/RsmF family)
MAEVEPEKHSSNNKGDKTVLSPELREFYSSHIDGVESFLLSNVKVPRFIRLNPRYDQQETLNILTSEMGNAPRPIAWLDSSLGFFAVDGEFKLAQSECFRAGRLYGMDVSSGAAVAVLLTEIYDIETAKSEIIKSADFRVLDLCCCPGLKLCAIADILASSEKSVSVVGVDISEHRLSLCKNIVKKYHVNPSTSGRMKDRASNCRIRIYHADGVSFGTKSEADILVFDSGAALEESSHAGKRKRMNKSARAREKKKLRQLTSLDKKGKSTQGQEFLSVSSAVKQFDRVLVDAECSTDGSIKHIQQQLQKSVLAGSHKAHLFENRTLTDPIRLANLVELQKGLIASGFRMLKSGGYLVYSTCSLSTEQNENVVHWLLGNNPGSAEIVPVTFNVDSVAVIEGSLAGTVRFLPALPKEDGTDFFGGGFFLAKIRKK